MEPPWELISWFTMVWSHHGEPWCGHTMVNHEMSSHGGSIFYRENHGDFFMGFPWENQGHFGTMGTAIMGFSHGGHHVFTMV